MRWLSSLWQQWNEFQAHYHAIWYRRRIDEFIAADPVNGCSVNASEWKIIFTATIAYVGVIYLLFNLLILLQLENKYIENVLIVATVHWGHRAVHFGVSSYMVRKRDRVAAYLKFKEWLQERA